MVLAETKMNKRPRPCGFRATGKWRKIKQTCLLSKIKGMSRAQETQLKLAVCITMYNENEEEFKTTLRGVIENYNKLKSDKELNFKKHDMLVFLICDGFERIPKTFLEYAAKKEFYDFETLKEKNFVE